MKYGHLGKKTHQKGVCMKTRLSYFIDRSAQPQMEFAFLLQTIGEFALNQVS
jgi:hypothetical protein